MRKIEMCNRWRGRARASCLGTVRSVTLICAFTECQCVGCRCAILSLAVARPCPETRRGVDEAAVEKTKPVSCETCLSETTLSEKDSPDVEGGLD
jgi:hypothetical protein